MQALWVSHAVMQWLEKVRNALCMAPAVFNCFLDAADLLACFGCLNWPGPACLLHLESEHSQILELLNRFCSMSGCPWFGWWWTVKQLQQTSRVFDDVCCMHWWNICNSLSCVLVVPPSERQKGWFQVKWSDDYF